MLCHLILILRRTLLISYEALVEFRTTTQLTRCHIYIDRHGIDQQYPLAIGSAVAYANSRTCGQRLAKSYFAVIISELIVTVEHVGYAHKTMVGMSGTAKSPVDGFGRNRLEVF